VARELGIRLVWIDLLCIIQDDPEDLAREIEKMDEVYGQAYLTVASTLDTSSPNGMFHKRSCNRPLFEVPFATSTGRSIAGSYLLSRSIPLESRPSFMVDIETSNYNRRGWTFQERFLSRKILYFCETMLYYECQACEQSEDSTVLSERSLWPAWCPSATLKSSGLSYLYAFWYKLVEAYSKRHLTYKSDKLPAVAGLAAAMSHALQVSGNQDTYLAGIWKQDLVKSLLWSRNAYDGCSLSRTLDYRAPSWCWSAFDGAGGIRYSLELVGRRMESQCSIVDVAVQNRDTQPFGHATGGYLQITGCLQHIDSIRLVEAHELTQLWAEQHYEFLQDDRVVATGMLDCSDTCNCTDCRQRRSSREYHKPQAEHEIWVLLLGAAHVDPKATDVEGFDEDTNRENTDNSSDRGCTDEDTGEATDGHTEEATDEDTDEATSKDTDEATNKDTDEATDEDTDEATSKDTDEATNKDTDEATDEDTDEATDDEAAYDEAAYDEAAYDEAINYEALNDNCSSDSMLLVSSDPWIVGLVLTPAERPGAEAIYRRVGMFCIEVYPDGLMAGDPTIFNNHEERTVTIV